MLIRIIIFVVWELLWIKWNYMEDELLGLGLGVGL